MLLAHEVRAVADVRRFPASRRHPHFARERLEAELAPHDIAYRWMPDLGGRRKPRPDSINTGWRVAAFKGYADYMETPEFAGAFGQLVEHGKVRRTAVMCAEALWWQCHRRLIADALTAAGYQVVHIETREKTSPHKFIAPARLVDGRLTYAAEQLDLG